MSEKNPRGEAANGGIDRIRIEGRIEGRSGEGDYVEGESVIRRRAFASSRNSDHFARRTPGERGGRTPSGSRNASIVRGTRADRARERMLAVQDAYEEFGIVRNIIDTMTDFTVQGISTVHPNPRIDRFYKEWFWKVKGPEVSSHLAQNLFLEAAAPVRRGTARLRRKDREALQRGDASLQDSSPSERTEALVGDSPLPDGDFVVPEEPAREDGAPPSPPFLLGRGEIPWSYTVLNPASLDVLGGGLAPFGGDEDTFAYAIVVPPELANVVRNPKTDVEKALVKRLPKDVLSAIKEGRNRVPLNPASLRVLHYKRRHWQVWAVPMTWPLLNDLEMLRKLKLADLAALDGAISHIRLWRLGSLENRMMPTRKAIERLADMLADAGGNGVSMDLIWGPDLQLQETSTEIHRFLGEAKYVPHLNAVYAGYGIPPTLTGAAVSGGFTNNFISLKTLTERLRYVRRVIREFWEYEIALVRAAFGFRVPATVRFDRMVLTDDAAEKALLLQLADRDLISVETIQERFGEDPLIEEVRQRQEYRKRDKSRLPAKSGPWHDPQHRQKRETLLLQKDLVTPSQVGLDLPDPLPDEEPPAALRAEPLDPSGQEQDPGSGRPEDEENKGRPGQGRPPGARDSRERKRKEVRPRTGKSIASEDSPEHADRTAFFESLAETTARAESVWRATGEVLTPAFLASLGKKTVRRLTAEEAANLEEFRFAVLLAVLGDPDLSREPIDDAERVRRITTRDSEIPPPPSRVTELFRATLARHVEREGKPPSLEKTREYRTRIAAFHATPVPV